MENPNDLSSTVASGLARYYEGVGRRVHALVDPLSTDDLWRRPFPFGNSVGHLLLHLTGNLSYYIGARIAGTGYVRDRPREFAEPRALPKEQVLEAFDAAITMVVATLGQQGPEDWSKPYTADLEEPCDRFEIFVRCASHAYHHAGQMIYLCKQLALR
jgi:uncharacterized damage-inducible protein DinB